MNQDNLQNRNSRKTGMICSDKLGRLLLSYSNPFQLSQLLGIMARTFWYM